MMEFRRLAPLALLLVLAAGCASSGVPPQVLQGWVGRPAAALEKDWGPPTREVQDGETRILVYEEMATPSRKSTFEQVEPDTRARGYGAAQAAANEAYRNPTVYVRSYVFWVNREGKIVNSAVRTP